MPDINEFNRAIIDELRSHELYPQVADYARGTERAIPVVALVPGA
jgi:hypothetical protein